MDIIALPVTCLNEIDYSSVVVEDRKAPFTIQLSQSSVLDPGPGENQKFCYNFTATGEDNNTFADLSHFVFEICEDIEESDLLNVSVVINGVNQQVNIGGNVEVFRDGKVDPPTGCPGLKFNFGLNKTPPNNMQVCFELATTYLVGSVNVCLFAASRTFEGLSICGPVCGIVPPPICDPTTVYQTMEVCVPITISPTADVGDIIVTCCGPAEITNEPCPTNGEPSYTFYVSRTICSEIPIEFTADGDSGTASVVFNAPNQQGCECPVIEI